MSLPAAEVAADFRDALQDLRMNSRPEISNLTLIAKENTEYAEAISTELENHVRSTRPEWKLPALYVLDSIVKNVGTPYTVYIGRNLYRTFMDAYLVMDQGTRKAMEGLLRTWKQPVPESMDPRPVFPVDVTRDIENALAKIRAAVQQQVQRPQHALPPRPPTNVAWRDTATPPQNASHFAAPNDPRARPSYPPTPQYGPPHTSTPPVPHHPQQYGQPMSSVDLAELKTEISQLINNTQAMFAHNPTDAALRTKLQALLSLKQILDTQTLPPQQLEAVRQQVRALAPPPAPLPSFPPAAPIYPPQHAMPPHLPPSLPPTGAPTNGIPPNVAQLLAGFRSPMPQTPQPPPAPNPPALNLADLLKRMSSPAQPASVPAPAPILHPFSGQLPSGPIPLNASDPPPPTGGSGSGSLSLAELLAQFSKPAVAPATPVQSTPVSQYQPPPVAAPPALGSADWLLKALGNVPGATPVNTTPINAPPMARQASGPTDLMDHIELTTASMKKPRMHLISRLYDAKPNTCATCGRRFENTTEGKEKKARHMDWHFKMKDPDAAKRGLHRQWYISEREWIEYREIDESSPPNANDPSSTSGVSKPKKQAKDRYVSVPQDVALQQAPCPICQEKFDTVWSVEANDFVWMDALSVGGKVYHATCFEEYSKGVGIEMPGTPDSVLGKRKADVGGNGEGKKVRAF
ncbi:hypothetical protein T440DRAFT_208745 [Plenodomus tracheiphilus IPT5]|uniref:CID domain-containing protein n=1 Tax=Plenodomus tracheiphilus IPT5 TaxID=1408161 RepID=A0A6A7BMC3_9PLEO|nr:hypothetical protein T440DRAFT_208745 [Plenodomus tracheiphilus IPT5]